MRTVELTTAQVITLAGGPTLCTMGEAVHALVDLLDDETLYDMREALPAAAEYVQQPVRDACPWWDSVTIPEEAPTWSNQESELQAADTVFALTQEHGVRHAVQVPDGWEPQVDDSSEQLLRLLEMIGKGN